MALYRTGFQVIKCIRIFRQRDIVKGINKMNIFIDTNIFLSFYHFSNDDLQELNN